MPDDGADISDVEEGPVFQEVFRDEDGKAHIGFIGVLAWFAGTFGAIVLLMRLAIDWALLLE